MTASRSSIPKIHAGDGRIVLSAYGSRAVFSELSSTYPLKLLSPRVTQAGVAVVYILTYGGGLVSGDRVVLSVDVESDTVLVLLSQGSTKVFKTRPGQRLASVRNDGPSIAPVILPSSTSSSVTTQTMNCAVADKGALFLLPEPVTCFRSASYNQIQTFHLSGSASVVILDWVTSGRKSIGEEWAFSRFYSVNEVWVDGKRLIKDVMLLDDQEVDVKLPQRTLCSRLAPYSCYAMAILYGPLVENVIKYLAAEYDQISVFRTKAPTELIWSLSPINSGRVLGAIVRVAGKETECVKRWLGHALIGLQDVIGIDVYRRAFV